MYVTISLKKNVHPRRYICIKIPRRISPKGNKGEENEKILEKLFNHGSKHGSNDLSLEKKGELYDLFRRNIKKRVKSFSIHPPDIRGEAVITATMMREIIDQWEVDTKRSSLRLLCFPDRTRHRTSSRYYLHQPPARPFSYPSILDLTLNTPTKTRIFGVPFHDHATKEVQGVRFYLYPSISTPLDIPVYLSFTLSRATKRNNVMKQETYIKYI